MFLVNGLIVENLFVAMKVLRNLRGPIGPNTESASE